MIFIEFCSKVDPFSPPKREITPARHIYASKYTKVFSLATSPLNCRSRKQIKIY